MEESGRLEKGKEEEEERSAELLLHSQLAWVGLAGGVGGVMKGATPKTRQGQGWVGVLVGEGTGARMVRAPLVPQTSTTDSTAAGPGEPPFILGSEG